jgi:hypothetical protein
MDVEQMKTACEIRSVLRQCTGTENYSQYAIGKTQYLMTDGVITMAEKCGAYWLIDLIVSHQMNAYVRREPFQVWELKPNKTTSGAKAICTDGNGHKIVSQRVSFTDFPLPEGIKIYMENNVIMLPSEY